MLAITIPYVNSWNAWFSTTENRPEGVPPLRAKVDAACRAAGRDPDVIADGLRAFAREGIGHQLVLDPISEASLEALKPVLDSLDGK